MLHNIVCRSFKLDSDYPLIFNWWKKRGVQPQEPDFLPPTGFVLEHNGEKLCAGFLFKTDAKIAVIGHMVSNPEVTNKEIRSQAIDLLIQRLIHEARYYGFRAVSCSSNVDRLNLRYESFGFVKSDENETHYGRIL